MKRPIQTIRYSLLKRTLFLLFFILNWAGGVVAQLQVYNHPELKWRTIETEHFFVHFHQDEERTASLVAKIAEEIYEPITSLYEYIPDGKIHFIVRDHDDESNGAAFYYDNKIEVWASAMDFQLRGTHNWLRNVVTHEYCHLISLGAGRKMPRQIPAVYLQWLDYEKEKRPDVIHGYPNTLVSFPMAGTIIPPWFAEGMAQFHRAGLDYDTWDTHRDMVLRTAVLGERLLPLSEMAVFGKNSLGNERVYNQGYGLTLYLVGQYGEAVLRDLVKAMTTPWRMSFSGAVKKVLQKSERALYDEWVDWLGQGFSKGSDRVRQNLVQGQILEQSGMGNFHPVFSPDGKRIAYLSNRGGDYLSQMNLTLYDLTSGKRRRLVSGVTSSVSWSPDGKKLVYAKKTARTRQGSHYYDLYTYDLKNRKEKRITRSLRARQPNWSLDGRRLVFIVEEDGTSNLAVVGVNGRGFKKISSFKNGEQIYSPRWFGNDGKIVFALSEERDGRDIAVIDSSGLNLQYLVETEDDERDPFPDVDGKNLYYSSDRTGIFNLYELDLTSGRETQLTNVLGGAFMPSVDPEGRLVYSLFTEAGYKIARIEPVEEIFPEVTLYTTPYREIQEQGDSQEWDISRFDDGEIPDYPSRPYKPLFSKISFLPRVMMDYPQKIKIGTYFYGSDYLDKISILGGVAVNGLIDTDIFGLFEYKRFYPTLFLEAYHQRRHTSDDEFDYSFDLMEVDLGADWRLSDNHLLRSAYVFSRYSAKMSGELQGQEFKFPYTYHIGNVLQFKWTYRKILPSVESGIAPSRGRLITLQVERAWQRFLDDFEVHQDYGTLVEKYRHYNYDQIFMDWREYVAVPLLSHSIALRWRAGIIDQHLESFYNFFAGGIDGLKGYPYYSIEGRRLFHLGLAYRFPIFRRMGLRFFFMNFNKLYFSLYGDVGNAWDRGGIDEIDWKRDVGIQIRLGLVAFYTYPMSLFFDAAYGLDRFENKEQKIWYGKEWRMYFGILFDFLD